jgi:adenylylsulfate kinase-like enzyme
MVIWITGISGSGKTTLANYLLKIVKKKTIYLDGDKFREIFNNDIKYSKNERDINAIRITKFTKFLSDQNFNIIVAANITNFKFRTWCRKNIKHYYEVFIKADIKNLLKRDYKSLYKNFFLGKVNNVVGLDIPFKTPKGCDIYINNNFDKKSFLLINGKKILNEITKKNIKIY